MKPTPQKAKKWTAVVVAVIVFLGVAALIYNYGIKPGGSYYRRLRSGGYTQGFEALKRTTGDKTVYCCLGVLCEQFEHFTEIEEYDDVTLTSMWRIGDPGSTHDCFGFPPPSLTLLNKEGEAVDWACLSVLNDVERYSFPEVADYIKRKGYYVEAD